MGKTRKDRHDYDWDDAYESAKKRKKARNQRKRRDLDLREYRNVSGQDIIEEIMDEDDWEGST